MARRFLSVAMRIAAPAAGPGGGQRARRLAWLGRLVALVAFGSLTGGVSVGFFLAVLFGGGLLERGIYACAEYVACCD